MTVRDADSQAQTRGKRLQFDRYVLDLGRGCLLQDGNEIALRPKTFGVLRYLIENSGRLVSKDELFAAVWPNLAITDDALVQSIGELRRALGDDGQRLIRTIPRRGYRFEAAVAVIAPDDPAVTDATPATRHEGAHATTAAVRTPAAAAFQTALTGWRGGAFAALALVMMLAVGALWIGLGPDRKMSSGPRTADQSMNGADVNINIKPAIAVLPLLNQSEDLGREYFVDGLTQDIINALGRFSELTVMSWHAVFPYKGKPARPEDVRRGLAAGYLVEGSVRQAGDRIRVIAQLVDTKDGRVLWSARFDEALADVFALQDAITSQIVGALAVRVAQIEQRRVRAKPTENLEAYDYVLRTRPALQRPTRANIVEARTLLRRAIELDPNYAAAYAALADTYHIDVSMGWAQSPAASLARAADMAAKALALHDSEVRARVLLGRIHIFYQRYEEAKAEIDRAIDINPNDALGIAGRGNILMWSGETDAAIEALELAQRIDPELNAVDRFALSLAYYLKRRYAAAIEQAELNLRTTAGANFSRVVLAIAYAQNNRPEDAAGVVATIRRLDPAFDPQAFGSKFLNPADLEHLREGFRKAGLHAAKGGLQPSAPE
jgi:TolB-like protein/DNA-binding winged helix-turn-helix (wHTH) protein/cytochrome c-type biogenesis protein CcmH/NrfG